MVVVFSVSLTGGPTIITTSAKASARRKLKSGPANATMTLSSGEIFGSFTRPPEFSLLPSITSMVAIWGSET